MKNASRIIFALGFGLALVSSALAESKQVTTLSTSAPATIVVAGSKVNMLAIANVGSNAINITFDSGSSFGGTDPATGATGNGQPLAAGQKVVFYGPWVRGIRIVAIMQSGTTTLNINTDAPAGNSTFPTN